ncbi:type IV pilin protein [Agaribacter flavus]|uniref:Type IV pilin protein n=1 Tax=Agaribacter flavus TaxID=1902781 RepID=A0ABV7FP92_9ALTE
MKNTQFGFTLIELLVVIAIVGIITAVAYPSYKSTMAGSARSAVQADLMAFAGAMERHNASRYTYKGAGVGGADTGTPLVFSGHSPASEPVANKKYILTISDVSTNGQTFILKASPVSASIVEGNGDMYLFSDGRKAWDKNDNGAIDSDEYCWNC